MSNFYIKPSMFANGSTFIDSEFWLVEKYCLYDCSPLNLQMGYQSCIGWQHDSTVLAYSAQLSSINFFLSILTILIMASW